MTTAPARIFVARLAGLPVYDPVGDQLGRLRDVVVTLRLSRQPPRVLGLVVEVQRKRIFVPMARVSTVDAHQIVLTTTRVSLRRFEIRTGETLVLGELLDRTLTVAETGDPVTLVDAGIEQARTRDWLLTRVAVVAGSRRRGELRILEWDEVVGLSAGSGHAGAQGAANLLAAFEKLRPADLATALHDLSDKRRAEVAAALDDERLADVLEEMGEEDQVEVLNALSAERAADVLEAMAPDDAADLLGELPLEARSQLLELMEPEEAAPVRRLLTYADTSAGGMMTTEPVVLLPDATVAEALARIRNRDLTPALAGQVYVTRPPAETPTGKYLGLVHFQRLLREAPSSLVSACVDADLDSLPPDCPLLVVTSHMAAYNLVAVPVVDEQQRLLGVVTVDDVLDHLLPEDWRERGDDGLSGNSAEGKGGDPDGA
ncbi:MAG: MgtE intracellular region [Mycobacterium sp.]|nr:MgtE intracellular region [Mycobacterium sp.]MCW2744766.1 MgtE intracellular region [Mycobacterium sp.]